MASTAYREAEPDRSRLGKAALMFLMHAPPVVVLQQVPYTMASQVSAPVQYVDKHAVW